MKGQTYGGDPHGGAGCHMPGVAPCAVYPGLELGGGGDTSGIQRAKVNTCKDRRASDV